MNSYKNFSKHAPGHPVRLQILQSSNDPLHGAPPFAGAGHWHTRVLLELPSPQDFEHKLQGVQEHHSPSPEGRKREKNLYYVIMEKLTPTPCNTLEGEYLEIKNME